MHDKGSDVVEIDIHYDSLRNFLLELNGNGNWFKFNDMTVLDSCRETTGKVMKRNKI
jgi:hypothetical protein